MRRDTPPARAARLRAKLTLQQAAKRLDRSPATLRQLERAGSWPVALAERGAKLYGCREEELLYPTPGSLRRAARTGRSAKPGPSHTAPAAGRDVTAEQAAV